MEDFEIRRETELGKENSRHGDDVRSAYPQFFIQTAKRVDLHQQQIQIDVRINQKNFHLDYPTLIFVSDSLCFRSISQQRSYNNYRLINCNTNKRNLVVKLGKF